ncbi:MAG: amidohydrolase [Candidatus Eremiobacteraeota bacterium]|nr:amidohydrolase [Candidatus Eremiobacteraeota bacterium]
MAPPVLTIDLPAAVVDEVVATRRDLHAHPELGFEEHRTSKLVAERLLALGYEVHTGIGKTGVVGVLRGSQPGKTIMLRADMDALPLDEENDVPYRSQTPVQMHACGHDGHVAMLLGAARVVAERRAEVAGTVCFLFQPAEEGKGGAKAMVEDRVLERFGIERAYGLHLSSSHPVGHVGFREGLFYASSDSIEITVEGKGGHGAAPHLSVDPVYVASQFVVAVQQIVSRNIDPIEPAVVTIGAFHGGTTHNVIPSRVRLLGTVRAFDKDVRAKMSERIERVLRGICESSGATYEFTYLWRYPVTSNDVEQTRYVRAVANRVIGEDRVDEIPRLMGAEDFSFFAERVPACFFTIGSNGGPNTAFPHHHARFDIDESALESGVRMMSALALDAPTHAP